MKDEGTIEAVIFDMDGLLLDTEGPSKEAWQRAAREIGEEIDDEMIREMVGRHIDDCIDRLSRKLNRDLRTENFLEKVDDIYFANFMRNGIGVKKGAFDLLDSLKKRNVPRAVATSTEKQIAPRKLRLAELDHYFEVIVSGCDVDQSKPAPDIFFRTADQIGVAPEKCVVLEDSYNGVRAAHAAGMTPIMIPDTLPPTPEMESLSRAIFPSLLDSRSLVFKLLGLPDDE